MQDNYTTYSVSDGGRPDLLLLESFEGFPYNSDMTRCMAVGHREVLRAVNVIF